ncbi:hypothetical protein K1T71_011512 [Dendrolimus kikuchii]|uniref:Uncharacterized protein n=1 Tax=Dendrolimus kikuchii TaxID=765133 RepID=A0ACC1CP83_9NEOP|nr:hypothetical protein K1T71_011512 [Dendrolimus kikuchii]
MEPTISKPKHYRASMFALVLCNAAALFAATKLVITLNPEDRISAKRGGALTALGFVYFITLFELLNVCCLFTNIGSRFRHKYRLSCGDVLDITNKLVSAVQAVLSCITGVVVCAWSCSRDFMMSSHYMSEAYAWFGAAYFFYDIWSMYMVHIQMNTNPEHIKRLQRRLSRNGDAPSPSAAAPAPAPAAASGDADALAKGSAISFLAYCRHEPVILMHHLFIGGFGFLVIVYLRGDFGDCTFGFVYLMELSTPFVSVRGILSRLRLKASRAYLFNGVMMLATFFVCRVASLPYVCFMYSRTIGVSYLEAIKTLPTGCKVSICILLLPQLYWFYLMSSGAVKMFLGTAKASSVNATPSRQALCGGDARDKRS